jgi:hypothetical protein
LRRAVALAAASVVYAVAAWSVRPGFYDGYGAPQYDYFNPPSYDATSNTPPTSGSGELQVRPDGTVEGGVIATRDQPIAQAAIYVSRGALQPPPSGGPVSFQITPYDVPRHVPVITLVGNVYCITANTTIAQGQKARVALMQPADQPLASAVYRATDRDATWQSLGGQLDLNTYALSADTTELGCFAVGYLTPKAGGGFTIGGSALPVVTAALIALVVLAGLPLALRRRLYNRH